MSAALHLFAQVSGRGIAVPAEAVESVVDIGAIVPAPRAHPAVRGLAALRSRVVTVVDTWAALGLPPGPTDASRAIVTTVDGHQHAVLVDSLEDVAPLEVQPLPSGLALGHRWGTIATGAAERAGEPLLVVDLSRLIGGLIPGD